MSITCNAPHPAMETSTVANAIRPILGETNFHAGKSDRREPSLLALQLLETERLAWEFFVNELEFE